MLDAIAEDMWLAVRRLIHAVRNAVEPPAAEEWAFGFGLLIFSTFREMNRLVSLQWGAAAPEPWSILLKILAVCALLPATFRASSKIG